MLVHQNEQFIREVRASLREQGLASQIMGSSLAGVNEIPSLAKGFYELLVLCPESRLTIDQLLFALGPAGTAVRAGSATEGELDGLGPVSLPEGFVGGRLR